MRAGLWACVLTLTFSSAATVSAQPRVRIEGRGYAYDVPAGWDEQTTPGVERMHVSRDFPGRSINITSEAFEGTSEAYMQASLVGLRGQSQVTIRASRPARVGPLDAFEIESDWVQDSVSLRLLQVGVSVDGHGYVLTCGDFVSRFAQAEPECRAIFRTFVAGQGSRPIAPANRIEGDGFSYTVPDGWREQPNPSVVRMHGSVAYPGRTINITTETFAGAPSAYLQASLSSLRAQAQITVRSSRPVRVGTREAYEIESDWSDGRSSVHLLQVATSYGGKGFVLTCGDLADRFAQAEPECRAIFRTFLVGPEANGRTADAQEGTGRTVASTPVDALTSRVRVAVDARSADLSECQAAALRRGPVSGQVELELAVRRDGTVARVRVVSDTTGSFGLAPCVQGVVSGVRVGDPPASETMVRHTVAFGR